MNYTFDAIVVGSGYGGSVSAYRLAQAGLKVAVLETGYRHSAPAMPQGEQAEWAPEKGHYGPHTVSHLSKTVTAWHGTAIGGGSIVNAAVMIRKDDFTGWPGNLSAAEMEPWYEKAEKMLDAVPYPLFDTARPYSRTFKSAVMLKAAEKLGVPPVLPPVSINYRAAGEAVGTLKVNQHGATQQGCRQCGECSLPGCNYQAKNSLDFNYLYAAEHTYGAVVLGGQKVDRIEPLLEGGYKLTAHCPKTGAKKTYHARIVVIAAGSVGSSELLLRNKRMHRTLNFLSDRLGQQYTTNGTFIGFAVRSKTPLDPAGGPEITAGLNFPGADGKSQGMLIFDGSFRNFSYNTFYVTGLLARLPRWGIKVASAAFRLAEKIKLVQPKTTLPLLVIGRDDAVGQFSLDGKGRLKTDLDPRDNKSFYQQANERMRRFARAMGTRLLPFPMWTLQKKIDVPHNLGGVPMGNTWNDGVVDDKGRVFLYDNLLVLDGSIIPMTMGANPALTIAALAERSMATVLQQWKEEGRIRAANPGTTTGPQGGEKGGEKQAPAAVKDASGLFHNAVEFIRFNRYIAPSHWQRPSDELLEQLVGKRVLWTQGFLARHMRNHSVDAIKGLERMGLSVTRVPVNTDIATAANIDLIKRNIKGLAHQEGILIGHSRGGNMNLDAYRQLSEEDKAKVMAIVLLQAPVNGSPVADYAIATKWRRRLVSFGSRLLFSNDVENTLVELSIRGREQAQRFLPPLTKEDRAKIVTLRTRIRENDSPSFEQGRRISGAAGHLSDGLTPYALSTIPGVTDVTLDCYDHEMLVIDHPSRLKRLTGYRPSTYFRPYEVLEGLLRVLILPHMDYPRVRR